MKKIRILKQYENSDYDVRLKARVQAFLLLFLIVMTTVLIIINTIQQYLIEGTEVRDFSHIPNGLLAIFFYCMCLYFLFKGRIQIASNVLIISAFAVLWFILFIKSAELGGKLQAVTYVVALISILSFLISQNSLLILIYTVCNIVVLLFFAHFMYIKSHITYSTMIDFMINVGSAIFFSGFVSFIGHWFNRKVFSKLKNEIKERKQVETELEKHKNSLESLVEQRTQELKNINEELVEQKEELYSTLTSLKQTQDKLVQAEKMASLGILTAGISHEINNPLNFIVGGLDLLESKQAFIPEKIEFANKCIEGMRIGADRITSIVENLNQFSRYETRLNENCDINAIIDNCIQMLHNQLGEKIEIIRNFRSDNIVIKGNISKLHQVFFNIILNAIQAISQEGKIIVETLKIKDTCLINISDNGVGIEKDYLIKVFDPFFTTKEPGKGTGLGLAITNSIVNEHDGQIKIDSEQGRGTSVSVTFKLFQSHE